MIGLRLPSQSVIRDDATDGHWQLVLEPRTAADDWNEQISLLTGMCAARIMVDNADGGRVGLLRTMPPPPESAIQSLGRTAAAGGVAWPADNPVGRMLAELDPNTPAALVLMSEATGLLLGATIMGVHAVELIHEIGVAISDGLSVTELGEIIHAHPTVSEMVMDAAQQAVGVAPYLS